MKLIMLINVKVLATVGILAFITRINAPSEKFNSRNIFIFRHSSFHEHSVDLRMKIVL